MRQELCGPLTTGALSGFANLGINKIFGSGLFSVPQDKVDKLIQYKNYLTTTQKKQIVNALQSGSRFNLKLRLKLNTEMDFFLSALASLAVPMVIKAITGKGKGKGLQIEGPQPYYGRWPNQIGRNLPELRLLLQHLDMDGKKGYQKKGSKGPSTREKRPFQRIIPLLGDIL